MSQIEFQGVEIIEDGVCGHKLTYKTLGILPPTSYCSICQREVAIKGRKQYELVDNGNMPSGLRWIDG